jgi:6-phosphogluconolactonase (cycloisomerase 2 family)
MHKAPIILAKCQRCCQSVGIGATEAIDSCVASSRQSFVRILSIFLFGLGVLIRPAQAQFLYTLSLNDGSIAGYSIGSDGSLTAVPGSPYAGTSGAFSLTIEPSARFLYVVNSPHVSGYVIGSDGALTPIPESPFSFRTSSARTLAVDPSGRFAYVANTGANTIIACSVGEDGNLVPISGSATPAGVSPDSIAVDPTAKFVYAVNLNDNTISGYKIGSDGNLSPLSGSPFATGNISQSMAIDPAGRFVYVANRGDNTVSAYVIQADGNLAVVPGSPFATGLSPDSVVVSPQVSLFMWRTRVTVRSRHLILKTMEVCCLLQVLSQQEQHRVGSPWCLRSILSTLQTSTLARSRALLLLLTDH